MAQHAHEEQVVLLINLRIGSTSVLLWRLFLSQSRKSVGIMGWRGIQFIHDSTKKNSQGDGQKIIK